MMSANVKQVDSEVHAGTSQSRAAEKILLVANTGWYLFNFRRSLVRELAGQGFEVLVVCPRDEYVDRLKKEVGVRWIEWRIDRASMNPLGNIAAVMSLAQIYRRESPDLVHHFTIKAILYGTLAAKLAKIDTIVNSVTGLGHVFLSRRLVARLVRPAIRRWYVWSLTTDGVRAVFQNRDDLMTLAQKTPKLAEQAILTRGSGVDLQRFAPPDARPSGINGQKYALFAGRLIHEKGIREFVEASRLCRERGVDARWVVCGSPDPGNPSSVDAETLRRWQNEGTVEFLGHVDDLEQRIAESDVVVLPSYREGTPRVLLEAAAMGKPAVATDVPGCREVVTDGENGLLVPARDPVALADAVERLLADDVLRSSMGTAGRQRMEDHFDEREVVAQTIQIYDGLLRRKKGAGPICAKHRAPTNVGRGRSGKLDLTPFSVLNKGVFVISLDFELAWGTRGRPAASRVGPYLDGTRNAVRLLLRLLEQYEIPATWAIVGSLLLGRSGDVERHPWLSDDGFSDIPVGDSASAPRWYAEDVIEWLLDHPVRQEIACHTLAHRFVDDSAEGRDRFRQELRQFRQLFDERYLEQPTSFIFPKAKMGHFDVLAEEGFRCIRGPESGWFEALPGTLLPAGFRLIDARLAVQPKVGLPERMPESIWVLPSSQFYSPFMSVGRRVSVKARVRKAVKGLHAAVGQKRLYHLWTHPFNLGERTDELLGGLEQVLQEAQRLREAGQLEVLTMRELSERLDRERAAGDQAGSGAGNQDLTPRRGDAEVGK